MSRSKIADDEEWLENQLAKGKAERNEKTYTDVGLLGIELGEREPSLAAEPAVRLALTIPVWRC